MLCTMTGRNLKVVCQCIALDTSGNAGLELFRANLCYIIYPVFFAL